MMSSVFYGEIKEDRLNTWKENKNPYDIHADNNRIERLGGWDFLFIADELFTDCVQVGWGSFAYKCTKEQLIELTRKTKCAISGIEREYPKVCVNLQTDVRYNYSVWRLFLWQEEKTAHKKQQ